MTAERINAEFSERVVVTTDDLPWLPSPQPGVERRPLDRIGGEVARATSLVRYAPHSAFAAHAHGLGEEFLVLEGVFSDEHGDYPKGTYVRNPPGSRHSPRTAPGCVILVKLRQMRASETQRVVVDTSAGTWHPGFGPGHMQMPLFAAADGEAVALERIAAGAKLPPIASPAGEEIFTLTGDFGDDTGRYPAGTWIRNPAGYRQGMSSAGGVLYWVKRGHLAGASGG